MKNQNLIIVVLFMAILGAIVYLFKDQIGKLFKPKDTAPGALNFDQLLNNTGNTPTQYVPTVEVPQITTLNQNLLLKKGMKNDEVKYLQNMINGVLSLMGKTPLVVDGSFGPKTENALNFLIQKKEITIAAAATFLFLKLGK